MADPRISRYGAYDKPLVAFTCERCGGVGLRPVIPGRRRYCDECGLAATRETRRKADAKKAAKASLRKCRDGKAQSQPIPTPGAKRCTKCNEEKPLDAFAVAKMGRFGRRGDCRACRRAYTKEIWDRLPLEQKRSRYDHRRDEVLRYRSDYYQRNKTRLDAMGRQWAKDNIEQVRSRQRAVMKRRRATIKGKLESSISRALYRALKGRKNGEPSFGLLGFTVEQLIDHLERQFSKGMTWGNYGKWHVDHILPLAGFRYELPSDPDFGMAWALTNLRPLWATENISKGAKRLLLL